MPYTLDLHAHLVQVPTGTTTWLPSSQFLCYGGAEFIAPIANGLMADLNSSLEKKFFDISVTQRKTVVEPDRVLDDAFGETMSVGL